MHYLYAEFEISSRRWWPSSVINGAISKLVSEIKDIRLIIASIAKWRIIR